jgi:hypothetical protein
VFKFILADDVFVAYNTGCLSLQAKLVNVFAFLQVMAVDAALRELTVLMKKVNIFHIQGQEAFQRLICKLQPLAAGDNGKYIFPWIKRQPEMLVGICITLHGHKRFKHCAGLFRHDPVCVPALRIAQDKMGFGIPGNYLGAGRGSQDLHIGGPNLFRGCKQFHSDGKQQQKNNDNPSCFWTKCFLSVNCHFYYIYLVVHANPVLLSLGEPFLNYSEYHQSNCRQFFASSF